MHELTEEALVAASVDSVWLDLTRAERLAEWIWPPRFETTAVVDLRELGSWGASVITLPARCRAR